MQGKRIRQVNNITITQIKSGGFIAWTPNNTILYVDTNFDYIYFKCSLCTDYIKRIKVYSEEEIIHQSKLKEAQHHQQQIDFRQLHYKCKVFSRAFELSVEEGLDSYDFAE